MSGRKTAFEMQKRRKEVANLYLKGYTQQQIADKLEVSRQTINGDVQAVLAQWRDETSHDMSERVAKQAMELADMRLRAWSAYQKAVGENRDGQSEKRPRSEKELNALALLLRIQEREAKLYGLDAPNRTEVSTPEPIQIKWLMSDESNDTDT